MCTSGPKAPDPVPTPPPAIQMQDEAAKQAGEAERRRRRSASGRQSTILAQPQTAADTARPTQKTMLG
ncbi:hypothetical protein [Vibrio harveyi]|uniref:hypothetical protein n=1 Tax=Vibrio harveyi TaxID=669 RepID=UPI00217D219D|nr:hypothetical protein [Vibrio harveyi]